MVGKGRRTVCAGPRSGVVGPTIESEGPCSNSIFPGAGSKRTCSFLQVGNLPRGPSRPGRLSCDPGPSRSSATGIWMPCGGCSCRCCVSARPLAWSSSATRRSTGRSRSCAGTSLRRATRRRRCVPLRSRPPGRRVPGGYSMLEGVLGGASWSRHAPSRHSMISIQESRRVFVPTVLILRLRSSGGAPDQIEASVGAVPRHRLRRGSCSAAVLHGASGWARPRRATSGPVGARRKLTRAWARGIHSEGSLLRTVRRARKAGVARRGTRGASRAPFRRAACARTTPAPVPVGRPSMVVASCGQRDPAKSYSEAQRSMWAAPPPAGTVPS